jgi:hypothetical protein
MSDKLTNIASSPGGRRPRTAFGEHSAEIRWTFGELSVNNR